MLACKHFTHCLSSAIPKAPVRSSHHALTQRSPSSQNPPQPGNQSASTSEHWVPAFYRMRECTGTRLPPWQVATGKSSSLVPEAWLCTVHSSWDTSAVREQSRSQWQLLRLRQRSVLLGQELKGTASEAILLAEGRSRAAKSAAVRLQRLQMLPNHTGPHK